MAAAPVVKTAAVKDEAIILSSIATVLGSRKVENEELVNPDDEWDSAGIQKRTGIKTRYWIDGDETVETLAVAAAQKLLKQEVEKEAECRFKDYYHRLKEYVSDLKVERTKKEADKQMLMNISCLVPQGETKPLANELEKIDSTDGFSVRFTGPWPPYSFVTEK